MSVSKYITHSAEETQKLAAAIGQQLQPNAILCFCGNLGAGKTTFIKGLAAGILGTDGEEINSPTFTYLNIYHGKNTLYHFDLYRLSDVDEFLAMGFDEMFDAGGICCIEWSEKIDSLLLPQAIRIEMTHLGNDQRSIEISELK